MSSQLDEFDAYGNYIAHKLRLFQGNQAVFARKLINDVIFEGELVGLTKKFKVRNSELVYKCSPQPPSRPSYIFQLPVRQQQLTADDEFNAYGKYIAYKLRLFQGNQAIFARKLINDVIFEGELNGLTKDFKVTVYCKNVIPDLPPDISQPPNRQLHISISDKLLFLSQR
uniref:Uncharacterized protein LOC114327537 isoform X2 n=1 Tax=Diabrotica virgifera virgifera TaxID=50390 RepID=A0A6P7FB29_DIAVI